MTPGQIQMAVAAVTRGELAEDPNDLVANLLVRYAGQLNVSLTVFDVFIVYLTVREYRRHKARRAPESGTAPVTERT